LVILIAFCFLESYSQGFKNDTLRLLLIGNSFSQNATRYLQELAKEGKHPLIIGRAEIGGCSLQQHWDLNRSTSEKPYKGKSLKAILSEQKWDIVSIQQNSMNSPNIDTYYPYADSLYKLIKQCQPTAEVVLHQTWAYRSDSETFGNVSAKGLALNEKEMWEKSRYAYQTIAKKLNVRIIPVGDAFWKVSSDKKWKYVVDSDFNYTNPILGELPEQKNSLHVGYYWNKSKKFCHDTHHASNAGCFLGSLVWYGFLFNESPVNLNFCPKTVSEDFSVFFKKTALKEIKTNNHN